MKRGKDGYYHLLYKTTNILTGEFYIGFHSTRILEDGYLGSGKRLRFSVKKYGKENFQREILKFCDDKDSLHETEKNVVTEEILKNTLCLNLTLGGNGGWHICNTLGKSVPIQLQKCNTSQRAKNGIKTRQRLMAENPEYKKSYLEKISKSQMGNTNWLDKTHSEETKQKMRKPKNQGEKNSQFGTCWIHHELIGSRKCKKELLPEYLEQGWHKGRVLKQI